MSQRMKPRPAPTQSLGDLKTRAEKAVREGRFQQALELAKQLHRQESSPGHTQFLFESYLGRARQLLGQGQARDATTVLGNTLPLLGDNAAWIEQVASEYAACGQAQQSLKLLEQVPGSSATAGILARAVDAALQQGAAGRSSIPEHLHAGFDLIVRAFDQFHSSQDDAARETLQGIGLQSPFLEWKLLLRGLHAYYQSDDAKALENWTRLTPDRLPYRLAAPLRFRMDDAFRTAQPPETQATLQRVGDRLQGSPIVSLLRSLQAALASEDINKAFKEAGNLLPHLKAQAPQREAALAATFYTAIIRFGSPRDLSRYRRLFKAPEDDPDFDRLESLALESCHDLEAAHESWQKYEKWIAAHPQNWDGHADRVRAMIWCHLAENAAEIPDAEKLKKVPELLRAMPAPPTPLNPPAEVCFRKSLELAPDLLETHQALVDYLEENNQLEKADAAARRLLEHFPEDVETLVMLGERCLDLKNPVEALELFERARRANPLDEETHHFIAVSHLRIARTHQEAKRYDAARAEYQAGLESVVGDKRVLSLCQWAICEFSAGQPERAEGLLAQARALAGHPLPIAHAALAESLRAKLAKGYKGRFETEYKEALLAPIDQKAGVLTLETLVGYHLAEIEYRGRKTHETRIITYLERVPINQLDEALLERTCSSLLVLKKVKQARILAQRGARHFPRNPLFPFAEAQTYFDPDPMKMKREYRIRGPLNRARDLAEQLPAGQRRDELLREIGARQEFLQAASMLGNPRSMMEALGSMLDMDDPFDDDDDEDEDSDF